MPLVRDCISANETACAHTSSLGVTYHFVWHVVATVKNFFHFFSLSLRIVATAAVDAVGYRFSCFSFFSWIHCKMISGSLVLSSYQTEQDENKQPEKHLSSILQCTNYIIIIIIFIQLREEVIHRSRKIIPFRKPLYEAFFPFLLPHFLHTFSLRLPLVYIYVCIVQWTTFRNISIQCSGCVVISPKRCSALHFILSLFLNSSIFVPTDIEKVQKWNVRQFSVFLPLVRVLSMYSLTPWFRQWYRCRREMRNILFHLKCSERANLSWHQSAKFHLKTQQLCDNALVATNE